MLCILNTIVSYNLRNLDAAWYFLKPFFVKTHEHIVGLLQSLNPTVTCTSQYLVMTQDS